MYPSGGMVSPNIHDLAPPSANFPSFRWFCLYIPLPGAPVTPLNSAASERESLQGAEERGPLSRIWAMTASSSAPTTLVSLCPEPSISEIPPYHCQDMPAYPPPSIKRFGHRKWFDLDAAYAPLAGDCNLSSTSCATRAKSPFYRFSNAQNQRFK